MKDQLKNDMKFGNTSLINFVNLSSEEKELIRKWRNHINIRKWMFTDHTISKEEHESYLKNLRNDTKNYCWLVKINDLPLGIISLNEVDFKNKNAYAALNTDPNNLKPGSGIFLFRMLINMGFKVFGLHTLKGEIIEGNRVLDLHKALGFVEEGRLREFVFKEGKWKDVLITGMINKNIKNVVRSF